MEYRRYKNTNKNISLLGFGGLRLPLQNGSQYEIDKKKAYEMVDYAISHGINYFDTGYAYHHGKSETFFGEALSRYSRDKFNLATKMPLVNLLQESDVNRIFIAQLQKCQVEYFDFYLLHNVNKTDEKKILNYRVYEYLYREKRLGYIKHLGFSFHDTPEQLQKTIDAYEWDFAQIQLNYMDWELQNAKEQYRILKDNNIPIIVMEPVRGGTLAKLCKESADIMKSRNPELSIASWAIRYAASFPEILTVLSGMTNMEQLQDNIRTMSPLVPLNNDDYKALNEALTIYQKYATVPCTGCRYCSECPQGIDIPSILIIYNTYKQGGSGGNRNPITEFRIRYNILREDKQAHRCIKCNRCIKLCPQHIDIPKMMVIINKLCKKIKSKNIVTMLKKNILFVKIYRKLKSFLKVK